MLFKQTVNDTDIEALDHGMKSYMICLFVRDEEIIFLFCVWLNVHEN